MKYPVLTSLILGTILCTSLRADIVKPVGATTTIAGDAGSSVDYLLDDNAGFGAPSLVDGSLTAITLENGDTLTKAATSFHELSAGGQAESWTRPIAQGNPVFVFDLTGGGDTAIGSVILWQYGNNGGAPTSIGNHAREFELIFHTEVEGNSFDFGAEAVEFAGTMQPALQEGALGVPEHNPAQVFFFGAQETARYVALRIVSNYAPPADPRITVGGDRYGLGEVRFATEALLDPELATDADITIESNGEPVVIQVPVENVGPTQNLTITGAQVSGLDDIAFTVATDFTSPLVVAPGGTSMIELNFDPSQVPVGFPIEALLEIDSDGSITQKTEVPIGGEVRNPWIDTVADVDLGTILPGAGAQAFQVAIDNLGFDQTLNVTDAYFEFGPQFSVTDDVQTNPIAVPAGTPAGSVVLNLQFDSGGLAGTFSDTLLLVSDDPFEDLRAIPVTVTVERDPEISAPLVVDAGPFPNGAGPHTITVTIQNLGASNDLILSPDPVVSGGDAASFSVSSFDGTIAPGNSGQIELLLEPGSEAGCFTTTLEIESNDLGVATVTEVQINATVLPQMLPGGLVAWYPLDDPGDPGADASGNGIDGFTVGAPTATAGATGATGGALSFDGLSRITVPWCEILNPASFTVTLWACPTTTAGFNSAITSRDDVGGGVETHGYILYNSSGGNWEFWTGDGNPGWSVIGGSAVVADSWVHLAIAYDANTQTKTLYVNGAEADSVTGPGLYSPNGPQEEDFHIGGGGDDGGSFLFNGKLDDVAVFSTALAPSEIITIRDNGVAGFLTPSLGIEIVSYDGSNLVVNVTGVQEGKNYVITSSDTLTAPWNPTGVTFTSATATGLSIPSPLGTNPSRFIRAEEEIAVP